MEEDGVDGDDDDDDDMVILDVKKVDGDVENHEMSIDGVEPEESDSEDASEDEEAEEHDIDEKHCRGAHLVSLYIATFLRTVRREWGNVDKHRIDKFYTAVRLMLSEVRRVWHVLTFQ